MNRAKQRLAYQHALNDPLTLPQKQERFNKTLHSIKEYSIIASQYACDRPLSAISIQPSSKHFATSSWSGLISIFTLPDSKQKLTLRGHTQRACALDWHPHSGLKETSVDLVSASTDGSILLYSLSQETPVGQIEGHEQRVATVKFHPSGKLVGTASHDATFRVFDLETKSELILQECAEKLHALAFHPDGSLVATGYICKYIPITYF